MRAIKNGIERHGRGAPTIKDDALLREGLREVLRRLRLARARGPRGRAAEDHLQRAHDRDVALVRERRDDEAEGVAQVLVAVGALRLDLLDPQVARRVVALPVEAHMRLPVEVRAGRHARVGHGLHDVARVHVDDRERADGRPLALGQVRADQDDHVLELGLALLVVLEDARVALGRHDLLDLQGPVDLRPVEHDLARPLDHPPRPLRLRVGAHGADHVVAHGLAHGDVDLDHPVLDVLVHGVHGRDEVDDLLLARVHARDRHE